MLLANSEPFVISVVFNMAYGEYFGSFEVDID